MKLAKVLYRNPQEIAQAIIDKMGKVQTVEKVELAKPAFINFL